MTNFWKIANLTILFCQFLICTLGTFYKHIAFGWGLGDILWYVLIYFLLTLNIIRTIKSKNKSSRQFRVMTLIFFILTVLICLKATIWRGIEYPWNGQIFYNN
jgi:ABC-type transport system involved in cytochrome c biogenesis permease component